MPIHNTEEVYNEWGAVIKKQDEIDQEILRRESEKNKLRQKNYRAELDRQLYEVNQRKQGGSLAARQREEQMLANERMKADMAYMGEESAKKAKLAKEQLDAMASLN